MMCISQQECRDILEFMTFPEDFAYELEKAKRIIALIGALILIGLYLAVLILGITASPATKGVLMAAIGCTIVLPCLLYAMMLIARVLSGRRENEDEPSDKN